MSRRRQQTAPERSAWIPVAACGDRVVADRVGGVQDASGVGGRACDDSAMRNRRDPPRRPTSGDSGPYKPTVKGDRAGRESEGPIVPATTGAITPSEERGPALVASAAGGKCEGMAERPNNPVDKVRQLQRRLFIAAKRSPKRRFHALYDRIHRGDVLAEAWKQFAIREARMRHEKTIGKPCAGKPHARFERGPQETGPELIRTPRLRATNDTRPTAPHLAGIRLGQPPPAGRD